MKCPFCRETAVEVYNSRHTKSGQQIWRRRRCRNCGGQFTTYEYIDLGFIEVVCDQKASGPFSRAKLFSSIYRCFSESKNQAQDIDAITNVIESKLLGLGKTKLTTKDIAEIVAATLKHYHTAAFLRYLSEHTEISGSAQLKRELKKY